MERLEATPGGGGVRALGKRVLLKLALAWAGLHLALHQSGSLADVPAVERPVETAFIRAGLEVEASELVLVWERPPGPPLPPYPDDFAFLEGRVHHWMATLGRGLGVARWRVLERREGAPFLLGLGGEAAAGVAVVAAAGRGGPAPAPLRVEMWAFGAEEPLAGIPGGSRGGLVVRFSAEGMPLWDQWFLQAALPTLPVEWLAGEGPHILTRWRLRAGPAGADTGPAAGEEVARALSARVVGRNGGPVHHEWWLASPRGGQLPPWAVPSSGPRGANIYVAGGRGAPPDAAARPRGGTRGLQNGGSRGGWVEVMAAPHPLSSLGRAWMRVWGGRRRPPGQPI